MTLRRAASDLRASRARPHAPIDETAMPSTPRALRSPLLAMLLAGTALVALPTLSAVPALAETPVFEVSETVTERSSSPAPARGLPDAAPLRRVEAPASSAGAADTEAETAAVPVPPEGLDERATAAIGPNERTVERVRRQVSPVAVSPVAASPVAAPLDPALAPPVDVRASFDGIEAVPQLNVDTVRQASTAERGVPLAFRGYWNYGAFVERAEIRIHRRGDARTARPLGVIRADDQGRAEWVPPANAPEDLSYRLRVYDREGRFDETEATALTLIDGSAPIAGAPSDDGLEAYGSDRTAVRNIPVRGGLVTVSGENVTPGENVRVDGREVPIDGEGRFVAETIVPHGVTTVAVEIDGPRPRVIERDVEVPETEMFYVALGEVTIGRHIRSDAVRRTRDGDARSVELTGRGAVYLKGRVKGDVLVTASADTGEAGEWRDVARGVHGRGARGLLQRIDPDRYYPVYGDDSDLSDGAPSRNGLFVRIERDDTFLQYGSYSVAFEEAELARLDRGVHGAVLQHRSLAQTGFGERKREVTLFAAENETAPGLDVFLGTGGTIYRLQRQDLVLGSERLVVEVRDGTSGLVRSSLVLRPGEDYDIDAVTGIVRLAKPLSGRAGDRSLVREGALQGDEIYLVARYEYLPATVDLDGYNAGARGRAWIGEHVRVGGTAQSEATEGERRQLLGADVTLRHSVGTYLKAEIARSEGPGYASATSLDGGLTFAGRRAATNAEGALAYRAEAAADLGTLSEGRVEGTLGAYAERFEAGFTGQRHDVDEETTRYGVEASVAPSERITLDAAVDVIDTESGGRRVTASADASFEATERVTASLGVAHDSVSGELTAGARTFGTRLDGILAAGLRTGSRTDVAGQVTYEHDETWSARAFAQGTVQRSGERKRNDRVGAGGTLRLNDRTTIDAEASYGTGGIGGDLALTYEGDDDVSVTLGYGYLDDLDAVESRFSRSYSHALNGRATKRYSDHVSVFSEGRLGFTDYATGRDLTQGYGIELTPNDAWAISGLVERGVLFETTGEGEDGEFERISGSLTVAYRGDALRASGTLEARADRGDARDADVLAAQGAVSYAPTDDWTLHGTAEWVEADGAQTAALASDYVKLVAAGAYRPVSHDAFNALAKYVYLSDLSPTGQLANGIGGQPRQRSHVASIDAVLDAHPRLTIGAKYALRRGEVGLDRDSDVLLSQTAQLAVLRADVHVTENWDVSGEARVLHVSEVDTLLGGVIGVWRQVGKVRVGGGYSFSSFSDDVTDLTHDDHGWFVNVAAAL